MSNNQYLFDLIKQNNWNDFSKFLKKDKNIDVNIRDESNNYLLSYAIIQNKIDIAKLLLERDAKLDILDTDGRSILYLPIKFGYNEILDLLLYFNTLIVGISLIDLKDSKNNIPIHYAINFKNKKAIELLIKYGSNLYIKDADNNDSLDLAIYTKDFDICQTIVDKINVFGNNTSLHIAVKLQLDNIVELLVNKKININAQDEHDFIPLYYAIESGNSKIAIYLINKGADLNLQDYIGNTILHYAIIDDNYDVIKSVINTQNLNVNLYNLDLQLPIHLLLEKKSNLLDQYDDIIGLLLQKSNLNFQDKNGNTPLHLVCKNSLFLKYQKILEIKKLNIFIQNNDGIAPIDYVDNKDLFIDIVVESYLYNLRLTPNVWQEDWENKCNKKMFNNQMSKEDLQIIKKNINKSVDQQEDYCKILIKDKLLDISNNKNSSCDYTSYPTKKSKKCIKIKEYKNVEMCTFTGIELDILSGLIYLLNKHKDACSPFPENINSEMCNFYKKNSERCNFFDIIWGINNKNFSLFLIPKFDQAFIKCLNIDVNLKRFIIIPLGIELDEGSHANYLIYDKHLKQLERFEPYGSSMPFNFDYNSKALDHMLEKRFKEITHDFDYIKPTSYIPKIGFQYLDIIESKTEKIGDPEGFCALWSIWYTDYRITYADIKRKKLIDQMLKYIKMKNISYKNLVRNYSKNITDIRDQILNKAGININDWINDQYTDKQIELVYQEINSKLK